MSKIDMDGKKKAVVADDAPATDRPLASPTRRKLIRLGATSVPVAATLASRPAYAWHCMTPSAWGSEQLDVNTSLKAGANGSTAHPLWGDETWSITNWKDNTVRTETGYTNTPWAALFAKYSALKTACGNNSANVTVAQLVTYVGIVNPGCTTSAKVRTVLGTGTDHQKYTLCAQLNFNLLAIKNDIDMCVTQANLGQMASLTYKPSNYISNWNTTQVKDFLYNNWIVVP